MIRFAYLYYKFKDSCYLCGLNGVLVTQLTKNLKLDHPTQNIFSHIIVLLKVFIQVIDRYIPIKF